MNPYKNQQNAPYAQQNAPYAGQQFTSDHHKGSFPDIKERLQVQITTTESILRQLLSIRDFLLGPQPDAPTENSPQNPPVGYMPILDDLVSEQSRRLAAITSLITDILRAF